MFKKFIKKFNLDTANKPETKPDTPTEADNEKPAEEKPSQRGHQAIENARNAAVKTAKTVQNSAEKSFATAKTKTVQSSQDFKNGVKNGRDEVTGKVKATKEKIGASFKKAAEERKKAADNKKSHPSSGSKMIDLIFPTGGIDPKSAPKKPDNSPKK